VAPDGRANLPPGGSVHEHNPHRLARKRSAGDRPVGRGIRREAKFVVALRLFEQGRISSGRAAELCGLPRVDFLLAASRAGVPVVDLDAAELDREFLDD
jgi:predicted HTH domain antitoxin